MHKKLFLASVGAIALTGSAALAAEPLPFPPPPPIFTWTGVYVGGQVGYAWGAGNFNVNGFDPITAPSLVIPLRTNPMAWLAVPILVINISLTNWSWASKALSMERA